MLKFVPSNYQSDNRMAVGLAVTLAIGVISACIGSLYYCRQPTENRDNSNGKNESNQESPFVRITIAHPHRERCLDSGACTDSSDDPTSEKRFRNFNNSSNNNLRIEKCCTESVSGPEDSQVVPVRPPRNHRRFSQIHTQDYSRDYNDRDSRNIWSSAMRNHLETIANSSSENSETVRVVKTEVEVHPCNSVSSNNETPDRFRQESLPVSNVNPSGGTTNESSFPNEGSKRHSSVVKKWKHLKKSIMCSRFGKSISIKEVQRKEVKKLEIPGGTSPRQSPMGHSTMLQKNRLVDASTSTRISRNIPETKKEKNKEIIAVESVAKSNDHGVSVETVNSKDDPQHSKAEVLQDVVSLIKRRSVNGKSLCDLRITGLAMNQSELLDLFEATGGKSKSASIITTEEASIISIKFQRDSRKNIDNKTKESTTSSQDNRLHTFYKILPDKLVDITLSKWFRSDERSSHTQESPFLSVPRHSLYSSPNDTSYFRIPRNSRSIRYQDSSPLQRGNNISRRLTPNNFAKFI